MMNAIYLLAPNGRTGGIEALFQLAAQLKALGRKAFLVPGGIQFDPATQSLVSTQTDDYALLYPEYDVQWTNKAVISPADELIIPEVYISHFQFLAQVRCHKHIWWLSVDNAFSQFAHPWHLHPFFLQRAANSYTHLYQSYYAAEFLAQRNVGRAYDLKCYINDAFLAGRKQAERRDKILYNPRKDNLFWRVLQAQCPEIEFQALQGLTIDGMKEAFATSKAYIDFGSHPGMDRIPREAALNDLIVVTGRRGSAANLIDVPIGSDFKFTDQAVHEGKCAVHLRAMLADYSGFSAQQAVYRRWIRSQKAQFELAVQAIWGA